MTTTFVQCPALVCTCGGSEVVTATYGPKTVRVAPCAPLRAQGWRGEVAVALSHSQALDLLVVA